MKITLDNTILNNIRELQTDGEENFLNELIELYKLDSSQTVQKIEKCVKQKDFQGVKRAAHNLKGSSANLGGSELAVFCRELEVSAENEDAKGLINLLPQLEQIYQETVVELEKQKKP